MMDRVLDLLGRTVLLPVLAAQGLQVRRRALILPEAAGPRSGITGTGRDLRLLVLGDSSAAGVGVATQDQALTGQLLRHLSPHFRLQWRQDAHTGATTRTTLARLRRTPPVRADAVILALGVNDTTRGVTLGGWLSRQHRLLELLRRDCGARHIYVSAVPPIGQFPLLPHPLRWFLGRHAARLDRGLQRLLDRHPDCTHVAPDVPLDAALMAEDGFHPGATIYGAWAETLADHIRRDFAETTHGRSHLAAGR